MSNAPHTKLVKHFEIFIGEVDILPITDTLFKSLVVSEKWFEIFYEYRMQEFFLFLLNN